MLVRLECFAQELHGKIFLSISFGFKVSENPDASRHVYLVSGINYLLLEM
jgi:hypothetical protein